MCLKHLDGINNQSSLVVHIEYIIQPSEVSVKIRFSLKIPSATITRAINYSNCNLGRPGKLNYSRRCDETVLHLRWYGTTQTFVR